MDWVRISERGKNNGRDCCRSESLALCACLTEVHSKEFFGLGARRVMTSLRTSRRVRAFPYSISRLGEVEHRCRFCDRIQHDT